MPRQTPTLRFGNMDLALAGVILLEQLFLFFLNYRGITSQAVNATGIFICSLLVAILLVCKFYGSSELHAPEKSQTSVKTRGIWIASCCVMLILAIYNIRATIPQINFHGFSDIIPGVQILADRFLAGKFVYTKDAWAAIYQTTVPGYFPFHWYPMVIAQFFKLEPRYVIAGVWLLGATLITGRTLVARDRWLQFMVPLLLLSGITLMNHKIPTIICVTVELMIAGYYMMFITAVNSRKPVFAALLFTFCILSRYYIVFWLPLWFFAGIIGGDRKHTLQVTKFVIGWVLVFYIIPFVMRDWTIVNIFGPDYERAARGEWTNVNSNGQPYHLYAGNGFAFYFFEKYRATDMYIGFVKLKKLLMVIPLLTVFCMGVWYYFKRNRIPLQIFLMASFKIFLTLFLALILVPYSYLNMVAGFLSIAILAEQSRYVLRKPGSGYILLSAHKEHETNPEGE
jgi:hypothetical protein